MEEPSLPPQMQKNMTMAKRSHVQEKDHWWDHRKLHEGYSKNRKSEEIPTECLESFAASAISLANMAAPENARYGLQCIGDSSHTSDIVSLWSVQTLLWMKQVCGLVRDRVCCRDKHSLASFEGMQSETGGWYVWSDDNPGEKKSLRTVDYFQMMTTSSLQSMCHTASSEMPLDESMCLSHHISSSLRYTQEHYIVTEIYYNPVFSPAPCKR